LSRKNMTVPAACGHRGLIDAGPDLRPSSPPAAREGPALPHQMRRDRR
jgi:hypothetical protein